jgi:hypothetical protein
LLARNQFASVITLSWKTAADELEQQLTRLRHARRRLEFRAVERIVVGHELMILCLRDSEGHASGQRDPSRRRSNAPIS